MCTFSHRFGFMPVSFHQTLNNDTNWHDDVAQQYVHCSGGMFTLIPDSQTFGDPSIGSSSASSPEKIIPASKDPKVTWAEKIPGSPGQRSYLKESRTLLGRSPDTSSLTSRDFRNRSRAPSPYMLQREYIRSRAESFNEEHHYQYDIGFLWCWNFMLTKRWRTSNTGDENFQDKMLADFRAFCSNTDNRLLDYWESCEAKINETILMKESSELEQDEIISV